MENRAMEVLQQERLLREAIDNNAFVLHYQPQVSLADGSLQGIKTLVRWQHPPRGLVSPVEFIAFAESRGYRPLTRWVMHGACRHSRPGRTKRAGPGPHGGQPCLRLNYAQSDMACRHRCRHCKPPPGWTPPS